MTPPPLKNCTERQQRVLLELYDSPCLEGYCRVIPPERLVCQCNEGWQGYVCDIPDYLSMASSHNGFGSSWNIILPVLLVSFFVAFAVAVITIYVYSRKAKNNPKAGEEGAALPESSITRINSEQQQSLSNNEVS